MTCASCGNQSRAQARFCEACGAALARSCSRCGAELRAGARFCDACGERAEERAPEPQSYTPPHLVQRILTQRGALEGERKNVAVLFTDVAGFTSLSERADPEQMHAAMDRILELLLAQVHRFEGTVNQFLGDGIMALFGAPLALEDAPRRAVMAALGMQQEIERLRREIHAESGLEFRMRVGIHSGLVVVGKIGNDLRMDYTAVGDTTNLASRLQTLAPADGILISETVHRLVSGFFDTREFGTVAVKGRSAPVRAFEVLADRAERRRIDVLSDRGLTPFAGREGELRQLADAYASAAGGSGQVVFLVGDAGIGKSRLLLEFRRSLGDAPHLWVEGRCASFGRNSAYLPLADALRRFLAIGDRDDEASALAKIDAGVTALGGELAWTLPFVRQLLSLPPGDDEVTRLDAGSRRAQTFAALKAITLQAAQRQPLVVVVEDLHWIDPASEEYLAFLGDAVPATRALLICSHRPGYRHPFGDRSYHVRIAVRPLAPREMIAMAQSLLGSLELPLDLRAVIERKAEGNPFFVEELTKSLVEEGALRRDACGVTLERSLESIAVPDTIQDVLAARIDRLADEPKRAIQLASVIGREFAMRLLERIVETGAALRGQLEELRSLELIYEKAVQPELAYMFKHALTHDVAYESILLQRRRQLHRTIGLAIEELYAERLVEHYETLAHHFGRGEDWERALSYHELAAEKAALGYATHSVVAHCRAALEIAERLGERVDDERRRVLLARLGLAQFYLSEYRASGDAYAGAAERARDPELASLHRTDAGHSYTWGHDYERGERSVSDAFAIARRIGSRDAEAASLAVAGFQDGVVGKVEAFAEKARAAHELVERGGSEQVLATAKLLLAEVAEWTGEYRAAINYGSEASALGRRLHMAHIVTWSEWFMGKAACCLGDYGTAIHSLSDAISICERLGDRAWRTRLLNTLGWCYAEVGADARAREYNERAVSIARALGDPEIIVNGEINVALNRLALGELGRASDEFTRLHEEAERQRDPWMRWRYPLHIADGRGRVALAANEPELALSLAQRQSDGARRHRAPKVEARALDLRGRALLAMDRRDEAEETLLAAVAVAQGIAYPRGVWRGLAALSELAARRGETARASELRSRARAQVESLAASLPDVDLRRTLLGTSGLAD
ncbi:MAG: ATP-binding protein [Myxococcota bacterium]